MVQSTERDEAWGKLAEAPEAEREATMLARYNEIAALPDDERKRQLHAMAVAEYALSDDGLRALTLGRLRTLLSMDKENAATLINSYNDVMQTMSANAAMRRVGLVQTLAATFSGEDEERLRELIPGMFASAPKRTGLDFDRDAFERALPPARVVEKKKPFWKFW